MKAGHTKTHRPPKQMGHTGKYQIHARRRKRKIHGIPGLKNPPQRQLGHKNKSTQKPHAHDQCYGLQSIPNTQIVSNQNTI